MAKFKVHKSHLGSATTSKAGKYIILSDASQEDLETLHNEGHKYIDKIEEKKPKTGGKTDGKGE